ncbi:major facilitator superfamily transporter [Zalerion maritima]|uniref:Major facilitator superfamily transporter n=1 Tax=Zalerion maritima TaxID=339359 RepID=A0AAD5RUU7_9PEZI|nr:major facilitator superfamily transporter [Zalerion maritima]
MPPYLFETNWLGWVQLTQVVASVLAVPVLGHGSDFIDTWLSKRHNGIYQPEYRLITLAIPVVCIILSCVIYGRGATNPYDWHWTSIVLTYHLGWFGFIGSNMVGITYAIDSFPSKAGPLLLLICAGRGFISFGLSYSTVPAIDALGYDSAMNIFAIVTGVLGGLAIPTYCLGGWVRMKATRLMWKVEE